MESVSGKERGLAISLITFMNVIPGIFFSPIGGWLVEKYGYSSVFLIGSMAEAFCLFMILLFIKEVRAIREETNYRDILSSLLPSNSVLKSLYIVATVDSFSWGLGSALFYDFLTEWYGYKEHELGILSSILTASWALFQIPAGKIMDRYGGRKALMLSEVFGLEGLTLWLLSGDFIVIAFSEVLIGLSPALWIPAINTYITKKTHEERTASIIGGLTAFRGLSSFPSLYIGGSSCRIVGLHAPLIFNSVGIIIALIGMMVLLED